MDARAQVDTEVFDVMVKDTGKPREELLKWAGTENSLGRVRPRVPYRSQPLHARSCLCFLAAPVAAPCPVPGMHLHVSTFELFVVCRCSVSSYMMKEVSADAGLESGVRERPC